jgi:dephospho-CoA kinase
MSSNPVPIIGFAGGVGSGKSTLAAGLARRWRVQVLDADVAGHAALEQADVQSSLRAAFGGEIFDASGRVVRSRLAQRVFGEAPEKVSARKQLEAVVHPVIRATLQRELGSLRESGACDLIVLDAAVMLESGWSSLCDAIVFIDVPREVRVARVKQTRGWSAEELDRREASQWPLDRKRAAADFVVANEGEVDSAVRSLCVFLEQRFPFLRAGHGEPVSASRRPDLAGAASGG